MAEIINFPVDRIKSPYEYTPDSDSMTKAKFCFQHVLIELQDQGYNLKNEDFQQDLGVLLNIIHTIICRADNKKHFLSPLINELIETLEQAKRNM